MERINVTLTAPKQLYQIVKQKVSPSRLFEIALRAVVGSEDMDDNIIAENILSISLIEYLSINHLSPF